MPQYCVCLEASALLHWKQKEKMKMAPGLIFLLSQQVWRGSGETLRKRSWGISGFYPDLGSSKSFWAEDDEVCFFFFPFKPSTGNLKGFSGVFSKLYSYLSWHNVRMENIFFCQRPLDMCNIYRLFKIVSLRFSMLSVYWTLNLMCSCHVAPVWLTGWTFPTPNWKKKLLFNYF